MEFPFSDDGDDATSPTAVPVGIRTLRLSGGSTVITIPPQVLASVSLSLGDDIVVDGADGSITLTRLSDSESAADTDGSP